MKTSDELKLQRTAKEDAQKKIIDAAKAEKREFTEEENTQFDALNGEIDDLDKQIERALKVEKRELEIGKRAHRVPGNGKGADEDEGDGEAKEKRGIFGQYRMSRALSQYTEHRKLDGVEKEVDDIAKSELRALQLEVPSTGVNIPASMLRAAYRADGQTVTQDGGLYGGVLVKEEGGEVLTPFIPRLTVEDLGVKVLNNLRGNYPLLSSEQFAFQNLGEVEKASAMKIKYEQRVMKPKRTACVALISNQLLIQSSIDVENDIRANIGAALNRRIFTDLIFGSGTGANPLGLLNDAIIEATAAQGPITRAKALELLGLIDDANSTSTALAYLTNGKVVFQAMQVPVDSGSGIMLAGSEGNIAGVKTHRSSLVTSSVGESSAVVYPLIYGDWNAARVGFWGGMNIMADPYTEADSNQLKLVINVHRDTLASNPKAFAVNKKITLS